MKRWTIWVTVALAGCAKASADQAPAMAAMPGMAMGEDAGAVPPVAEPAAAAEHAAHAAHGYAPLTLDPKLADRLDIAWATVENRKLTRTVRAYGAIVPDETRTSHVHPRVRGWIDKAMVDFTGEPVQANEALCTIYSPEVYAAQMELLALRSLGVTGGADDPFAAADRRMRTLTVAAGRRRLQLWDMPPDEIAEMQRKGQALRTFTLHAPRAGTVVARQALVGMYVDASTELYTISDLTRVWAVVDVYAADWQTATVGAKAMLHIEGRAEPMPATVKFVAPRVTEPTRTLQARFELDNPQEELRPGTWLNADIERELPESLVVPAEAVIPTGERFIAFVAQGQQVVPRLLQVEGPFSGFYRVISGLSLGDKVAASAQFLLDSESRIRASGTGGGHVH
jgi:Cu(I)/Ag(I) efflux system membrane fusion protein